MRPPTSTATGSPTVFARYAVGGPTHRFVFGVVPTLAWSGFDESGWLGDGTQTKPAFGAALTLGGRSEMSPTLRLDYRLFAEYLRLPANNPLLADGGDTWMIGVSAGIDLGF
jgi:hypothetical protein